jgi:uncharacterized protein (DUF302 family)
MYKKLRLILIGVLLGAAVALAVGWHVLPGLMIKTEASNHNFDDTVAKIESEAVKRGWIVPEIYDMQYGLQTAGHDDMRRMKVISLCLPDQAYSILRDDYNKRMSSIMPCRVGVFEAADGKVYITRMNLDLMSRMFGGKVEDVLTRVDTEQDLLLEDIAAK